MDGADLLKPLLVCLYEDRPSQITGLKVLLLTLDRYCPSWPIHLRFPDIPASLRIWLEGFQQVTLSEERLGTAGSYNVKPLVLLDGLSRGAQACLWLDTDILLNDALDWILDLSPESLLVTEDPWAYADGSTHRCSTWGLVAGRPMRGPVNSAVIRVTGQHEPLLQAWHRILLTPSYLAGQRRLAQQRDQHMLSDQDALSALLASQEFATIPVVWLRHATDVLHHHGAGAYGAMQRWPHLKNGMPALIHAMGSVKPWKMRAKPRLLCEPRDYYERTYLELSPYVHYARKYRSRLGEDTCWLDIQTVFGRLSSLAALNRPALKGMLQAVLHRSASCGLLYYLFRSRSAKHLAKP